MELITASLMSKKELENALNTNIKRGLTEQEAKKRLEVHGKNIIEEGRKRTIIDILVAQFRNFILWLLIIAVLISLYINKYEEAIAISVAIILSVIFGAYLEYKADKSIEELSKFLEEKTLVLRDGEIKLVESSMIVPGDIIFLSAGQKVPADCYIVEANDLEVNEATLTGESTSVKKKPGKMKKPAPIYELKNILFANSHIIKGNAKAIVVETGKKTEIGKIAEKLKIIKSEEIGLYKDLEELSKNLSLQGFLIIIIILLIGLYRGIDFPLLLVFALTLAVAVVPEGLTTILTIILGINVKRMAENNALVRRLVSIENLGRIEVVAVDKTGTLTKGQMSLVSIYYNGRFYDVLNKEDINDIKEVVKKAYDATDVKITKNEIIGDEIDKAIAELAISLNIKKDKAIDIEPFSSEKKYMSVTLKNKEKIIKGAVEVVMKKSDYIFIDNQVKVLDEKIKEKVIETVHEVEKKGRKSIALAIRKDKKTILYSILFFIDPPKEGAKETVKWLKENGIKVIMLTGDNVKTAEAIANEIGIEGKAILWSDIEDLDDEELAEILERYNIIARSLPIAKLRIVEVLSKKYKICTIGDGVNDALALKKSHVSVVMGKNGATVSKEIADIVLVDDNIFTLTKAINFGKNTIENINNFLRFQLTANNAAIYLILLNFIFGMSNLLILLPLHVLWINLIIDGPPALAQGFELKEIKRKNIKILDNNTKAVISLDALFIAIVCFFVFIFTYNNYGYEKALTYVFTLFVFFQCFNALNARSLSEPFYANIYRNKYLLAAIIVAFLLQIMIINNATARQIFSINYISFEELIFLLLLSFSVIIFEELRKMTKIFTS
jgi:Ca2+-transporting ATPase